MFDLELNELWIQNKAANTPLAKYLSVNFKIASSEYILDNTIEQRLNNGQLQMSDLNEMIKHHNNVVQQININWTVLK